MDFKTLKKFIKLAKDEGVHKLSFEHDDLKMSVSFGGGESPAVQYIPSAQVTSSSAAEGSTKVSSNPGAHEVNSPLVGTFYKSAAPGEAPYVQVGDIVSAGQTLCIVEAMKIMNEIEAEVSGEVVEICVDNESLVEFGQTLFKIKAK